MAGLGPEHAGFALERAQQMSAALIWGQIPPRWMPDAAFGMGYPLWVFHGPLAWMLAALLSILGAGLVGGLKVSWLLLLSLAALGACHRIGLLHRDVKPSNVFLHHTAEGVGLKLLDFGVSKQTLGIESLTKSGDVIGTLAYMSPEQLSSSRKVDARSDIWSLGVVLYELVCGHRPFNGRSDGDLCLAIMQHDAAAISESSVAPEVRAALQRCLQKDRARRYPDVVELAAQLAPVAGGPGHVQAARVARAATGTAAPLGPTLRMDAPRQDVTEPMLPELGFVLPTRRRWLLPLMILVVLGVIGVVALVLANRP